MQHKKPDRVERTFHLLGWMMMLCCFPWWTFQFVGGAIGAAFALLIFGWALLGLYRWGRDR